MCVCVCVCVCVCWMCVRVYVRAKCSCMGACINWANNIMFSVQKLLFRLDAWIHVLWEMKAEFVTFIIAFCAVFVLVVMIQR